MVVSVAGLVVGDLSCVVFSVPLSMNLGSHLSVAAGVLKPCSLPLWLAKKEEEKSKASKPVARPGEGQNGGHLGGEHWEGSRQGRGDTISWYGEPAFWLLDFPESYVWWYSGSLYPSAGHEVLQRGHGCWGKRLGTSYKVLRCPLMANCGRGITMSSPLETLEVCVGNNELRGLRWKSCRLHPKYAHWGICRTLSLS